MDFHEFWHNIQTAFNMSVPNLLFASCIFIILAVILICAVIVKSKIAAILISAFLGCILMIPIYSSYQNIVKNRILTTPLEELDELNLRADIRRNEREILQRERELREMAIAMERQSIEIETLNESIKLLERTHLNIGNFQEIFQVALLQTNIRRTTINRQELEGTHRSGLGFRADDYYDELLVIISHDVDAKFGIDLEAIRILKIDDNSIVISGVTPIFIGAVGNNHDRHVAEVRRVNMKDNFGESIVDTIVINNDRTALRIAEDHAWDSIRQFQENLSNGNELGFMDSAVIQLSQNFLKYIFSPFYANIEFSIETMPEAVPFMEYFQTEANTLINQRNMLLNIEG